MIIKSSNSAYFTETYLKGISKKIHNAPHDDYNLATAVMFSLKRNGYIICYYRNNGVYHLMMNTNGNYRQIEIKKKDLNLCSGADPIGRIKELYKLDVECY
jgi:hypothetical protein